MQNLPAAEGASAHLLGAWHEIASKPRAVGDVSFNTRTQLCWDCGLDSLAGLHRAVASPFLGSRDRWVTGLVGGDSVFPSSSLVSQAKEEPA